MLEKACKYVRNKSSGEVIYHKVKNTE